MENKEHDKILEAGKSSIFLTMETWTSQSLDNIMGCNSDRPPPSPNSAYPQNIPFQLLKTTNNSLFLKKNPKN